jgi:hypothetical protein
MISDKIHPHHLERKALLYVRQSSAHQVLHCPPAGVRDALVAAALPAGDRAVAPFDRGSHHAAAIFIIGRPPWLITESPSLPRLGALRGRPPSFLLISEGRHLKR